MANDWHFDREQQRRMKQDKLLKVAAECFNQKGFSGTSLKDIARKLSITDAAGKRVFRFDIPDEYK